MKKLIYPVIITEVNDEDGHYFGVSSPNIEGMVTQGKTLEDAVYWAEDAIATMLEGEEYPKPQDPRTWKLETNESVVYVTVDMEKWLRSKSPKIRKNVSVPEYLVDLGKKEKINFSQLLTEALENKLLNN
ncbi:type II toxin-antitoxin system HicB family antitoxin [Lactobacillus sp. ESL0681]|uniref:type II toxin-antitoxin system HicB family antitoxin n=1 Tax=Lactobacillus sp. ESL0681 TaxID=2983211 RepID=UPI0023F624C7|nr:type II toxin-antitoxin system HicB family antitoxin [Lactobacillus sp. ESL0681]WEV39979.1 type II toxin-antitoxin system HicB family antitoxin [Lactobacillus sp. ESL0681]